MKTKFIKLTNLNDDKIYINLSNIACFFRARDEEETVIQYLTDCFSFVKETPVEILQLASKK